MLVLLRLTLGVLLDQVLGHQTSDTLGASKEQLVGSLALKVLKCSIILGVCGNNDTLGLVFRTTRQTLPQLLGQERHEGVD